MNPRTPSGQYGMSLIELMVSLTLSLLLLAGVFQIFISSKQGYQVQQSAGLLQENTRFALRDLTHFIHSADYWGGVEAETITLHANIGDAYAARGGCDATWALDLEAGIFGYDGATAAPGPTGCLPDDYVPDTDVIVLRGVDADDYASTAALEDPNNADLDRNGGLYVRTLVGSSGHLFQRGKIADAKAVIDGDDDRGVVNHRFDVTVLYLADFEINGRDVPTLEVLDFQTVTGTATLRPSQLVENVEQMQFAYGVDRDDDLVVDIWENATALTAADWEDVISVRIGLIVRGDALDEFVDTNTYTLPGGFSYTPPTNLARYQRRMVVRDVQIRNRVRK